ncbi:MULTISPECIES: response regulator transcription factor [Prauserella]|uniref:response regulator n=1 Tax=Prauserella TaxID=142577 RepID=UPI001E363AEB|nr:MULTISPECIES: response regulator transcription factor [Prauserella]
MSSSPAEPPSPEAAHVRLLLVEDHSMVAMALGSAFESVDDIELVGHVASIKQAVAATERERPDVVLLDRRLPDGDGIDAIATLRDRSPDSRVLVFTGVADRQVADRVAEAGGAGLLLKAGLLEDLLDTIRRVAAGQQVFDVDSPERPGGR